MANHKSAFKRIRQNEKRRLQNRVQRGHMRASVKALRGALESGDTDAAEGLLLKAIAIIDSSRSKGVLHRNTASRRISRLSLAYNKAVAAK
jgi:small subunit ribosomal protein S20